MTIRTSLPLLLLALIGMSSCTFYKPTLLTTPVVEEKGEVILGGSTISSTDGFIVFSPIQNVSILAEASSAYSVGYTTTDFNGEETSREVKNLNYEFALGYYDRINDNFVYNIYAGYAFGESGSLFEDAGFTVLDGLYSAEYTNTFVQGTINSDLGNNLFLGFNLRTNFLNYSNFDAFSDSLSPQSSVSEGIDDPSKFVGQVGIDLQYKGGTFGGFGGMQYGFSPDESGYFSVREWGINLGVYLRIDALFKN